MVRPRCHKNEQSYLNANYTFKYRHKNASGTNTGTSNYVNNHLSA